MVAFAVLAAMIAAAPVRGGSLEIEVTDTAGDDVVITDNGPLDSNPTVGVIDVNVESLNGSLVNSNPLTDLSFTTLRATSNAPGGTVRPLLSLSGTVARAAGSTSSSTVTIRVSDNDFNFAGASRVRTSSSETFLNTGNGDRFTIQGFLDPGDVLFGMAILGPSSTVSPHHPARRDEVPVSMSQNPRPVGVPAQDGPFALTAQVEVTLGRATAVDEDRSVQFATATAATKP
jgi:hypothetical protein